MSDEKIEQEQAASAHHEMAATPFGVAKSGPESPGDGAENEPEKVEQAVEEPQAEAAEPEAEPLMSMEEALASTSGSGTGVDYSGTFKSLTEGDVVDGVVVHIDREGVLVDVGTKSEGTIKPNELSRDPSLNPEDVVAVGDKIRVYVVQTESHEGGPVLSKKRADFETAWDRVEKAFQTGEVLKAMVSDRVKGGLVVDLGIRGFVPASHVGSGKIKNLEKFVGQSLAIKVIEVDRERRKVVLSNRQAADEEREDLRKATVESLAEGQTREGVVRRLTDYGAFVDLGGVDGLLHISEMSWTRINHPSEVVKAGQKIQIMVLKLDRQQGRISLGLRQILPDPWVEIRRIHTVGETIKGTVSRVVPFGAFVQVEGGVEGIIPNAELAVRRVSKPEEVVSVGQEVEVKVIDLRPDERRMTLSLRQLQAQQEREEVETEYRSYSQSRSEGGKTTIGDLIGDRLDGFTSAAAVEKPAKKKSRARAAKKEALEEAEALADFEEELEVGLPAEAESAEEQAAEEVVVEEQVVEEEAVAEVEETVEAAEPEETPEPEAETAEVAEAAEVVEVAETAEVAEVAEVAEAVEVAESEEAEPEVVEAEPEAEAEAEAEAEPEQEAEPEPVAEESAEAAEEDKKDES